MPSAADRELAELGDAIRSISLRPSPILEGILPDLARACDMPKFAAYRVDRRPEGDRLEFIHGHGLGPAHRVEEIAGQFFANAPRDWGAYDPACPNPGERNRAVLVYEGERDLANAHRKYPLLAATAWPLGIVGHHQLRVLVCDGPSLLTWLGGFSPEPFTGEHQRRLEALAVQLRPRLVLERQLSDCKARAAALDVAAEAIPSAAFLIDRSGHIVHANTAGRALVQAEPGIRDELRVAAAGGHPRFTVNRVCSAGCPPLALAIVRSPDDGLQARLAVAAKRFGLTPRQTEVLGCLARGLANRTIADTLGCSVPTVELHVGQLLERSGAECRAHLVAIFWSRLQA